MIKDTLTYDIVGSFLRPAEIKEARKAYAYGHFPRPAGPHFPDSLGHIKRTAQ